MCRLNIKMRKIKAAKHCDFGNCTIHRLSNLKIKIEPEYFKKLAFIVTKHSKYSLCRDKLIYETEFKFRLQLSSNSAATQLKLISAGGST